MNRRGLTLIELLVTLALTGLLTASALAVVASVSRTRSLAADDRTEASGLEDSLLEVIEPDLTHATRYRNTAAGFEIETLSALTPGTMVRKHVTATVLYDSRQQWLMRTQTVGLAVPMQEVVGRGITNIDLQDAGDTEDDEDVIYGIWQAPPEVWRVTVTADDEPLTYTLRLR